MKRLNSRRILFSALTAAALLIARPAISAARSDEADRLPNIVIIFTDDQGYADVGCYGAKDFKTPHLDRLAAEGVRFTDFYVGQPVCSASRAALLTGCYSNRIGILGALGPRAQHGIHADEQTIAEVVKQRGYATAAYGKWHLGHHPKFLPTRHGFDEYFGLPYSNDMWPFHPTNRSFPDLPLIEGEKAVEYNPDQSTLTTRYTERAVRFIDQNKDRPFLLYLAHSMPHVPLFVSSKYKGKSIQGLYGDVIAEIDWSVGQVMAALRKHDLDKHTLVIFASDNGPWLSYGNHAGSTGPLRVGKGTTFDGGVRVPCLMRWPGKIPAGIVCREPVMTIDVLPTVAKLVGVELSSERTIDGLDIWPLMAGQPGARSPHDALYFYWGGELQAMRSGKWKLHFPHRYRSLRDKPGSDGTPGPYVQLEIGLALFDMEADIGETTNLADRHPDVVKRLTALANRMREELGDSATKTKGKNAREPGRL